MARSAAVIAAALSASLAPPTAPTPAEADPVVTAAGDIAHGGRPSRPQGQTARLVLRIDPRVALTLGDNQYPDGALRDFRSSYDPTWGRFKRVTRPVPGNHEYNTRGAHGYFDYFGARAHPAHGGYYSFNVGGWHLVAVNSGTGRISDRQLTWIRRDLRRSDARCELAYWHHPRWSSGTTHGSDPDMAPLWMVLYRAGVDVVLNGHEHNYERFAKLAPSGSPDLRHGIREFVVGTGGASHYGFGSPERGSLVRISRAYGVLRLRLQPRAYRWAFLRVDGRIMDRGRDTCHR